MKIKIYTVQDKAVFHQIMNKEEYIPVQCNTDYDVFTPSYDKMKDLMGIETPPIWGVISIKGKTDNFILDDFINMLSFNKPNREYVLISLLVDVDDILVTDFIIWSKIMGHLFLINHSKSPRNVAKKEVKRMCKHVIVDYDDSSVKTKQVTFQKIKKEMIIDYKYLGKKEGA